MEKMQTGIVRFGEGVEMQNVQEHLLLSEHCRFERPLTCHCAN